MKTRNICSIAVMTALMCTTAFIKIPIATIPITLQSAVAALSGIILGGKRGAVAMSIYMLIGLIGIPVFAGSGGGIAYFQKPSFGFIIGFILCAFISGSLYNLMKKFAPAELSRQKQYFMIFSCMAFAVLSIYLVGIPYMIFILSNVSQLSNAAIMTEIYTMPLLLLLDWLKIAGVSFLPFDTLTRLTKD